MIAFPFATTPRAGLVVWFKGRNNEQAWPAVISANLNNRILVKILGNDERVQIAKQEELTPFECYLENAIVSDSKLRTRLSVSCLLALEHAKSKSGIATQRKNLESTSFTNFLTILSTQIEDVPEQKVSQIDKSIPEDLPEEVGCALAKVYEADNRMEKKMIEYIKSQRDIIDAELLQYANECSSSAWLSRRNELNSVLNKVKKEFEASKVKQREASKQLESVLQSNSKGMKRRKKNLNLNDGKKRVKKQLSSTEDENLVEEEVLDGCEFNVSEEYDNENGNDDENGNDNDDAGITTIPIDLSSPTQSRNYYKHKDVFVEESYERARDLIGLRMVSDRYASGSPSGDREEAFTLDLNAWWSEHNVEQPRVPCLGGVELNHYKAFQQVIERGGINPVVDRREVTAILNTLGHASSAKPTRFRTYYMDYLYDYELSFVKALQNTKDTNSKLKS